VVAELGGNAFPFVEENLSKNRRIRMFPETVWEDDLVWHRDAENRTVKVLSSNGWKLQMDDQLPKELVIGETHYIPKNTYHRIIKGIGELIVEIVTK
jgi:hypothetical protein